MKYKYTGKLKIIIAFGLLFLIVSILLMLIFLEGKKTYTVQFDPNGGTVLSGSLEQHVMQGQDAVPPSIVKDGAYLRGWSTSYRRITRDIVIEAVWEYETTAGIIYTESENKNFTEVLGSYEFLRGEVYLDTYFEEKKVLAILDGAFKDRTGITNVYLLDGLLKIGVSAFENCTALTEIEIPETVAYVGKNSFKNCYSLTEVVLYEGLSGIGDYAFEGCTGLTVVTIPTSVTHIGENVFAGCHGLVVRIAIPQEEWPEGWADNWFGDATIELVEEKDLYPEEKDEKDGRK